MKRTWAEGRLIAGTHLRSLKRGPSKLELDLFRRLAKVCPHTLVSNKMVRCPSGKLTFPDILVVEHNHVIEFMGDSWHANPIKYGPNDIVWPYRRPAKDI